MSARPSKRVIAKILAFLLRELFGIVNESRDKPHTAVDSSGGPISRDSLRVRVRRWQENRANRPDEKE